jgi:HD-like signal output (HDOD) protein
LQLSNSGLFGRVRQIESIPHAVGLIGPSTLRRYAIRWTLGSVLYNLPSAAGWDASKFSAHAEATALLADNLSDHLPSDNGDGAFVAGLVHDIGKFAICAEAPDAIEFILTMRETTPESVSEVERDVLGIDHAEISSRAAEKWRLGDDVCQAVACHHEPYRDSSSGEIALSFVLAKADSYVNGLGLTFLSSSPDAAKVLDWPGYQSEVELALHWFEYGKGQLLLDPQSQLQRPHTIA